MKKIRKKLKSKRIPFRKLTSDIGQTLVVKEKKTGDIFTIFQRDRVYVAVEKTDGSSELLEAKDAHSIIDIISRSNPANWMQPGPTDGWEGVGGEVKYDPSKDPADEKRERAVA